ncbi:hypothetical protein FRC04_000629 [Tulasnella sp. 424]|nr:hypothetical protein FRC04_000629 [Tulasnella sp. 424]KAG8969163.1 hypothetical protein FRC05_001207 [Tulasnella sp. 425]
MSHAQCLPPELLSYVLKLACIAEAPAQAQAAHILGRVSKLWRETVFSNPAIWTTFYISKTGDPRSFDVPLLRSGVLPVDVRVVDEATKLKAARAQLEALARHSARWKSVEISHPDAFDLLGKAIPLNLPKLQSFVVKSTCQRLSPSLVYLYSGFPEYPFAPDIDLEWKSRLYPSLRQLDLCDIEVRPSEIEDFLGFLQAHDGLEKLALRSIWEFNPYTPPHTVVLPKLKDLELRGFPSSEVLRWIDAPNLQNFVVEKSSQLRYWTTVDIKSNYATANDVTLIQFSTAPDALRNVLSAVPLASHLKLASTDLRARYSFCAESILTENELPLLASLHIQGIASMPRLKAVVETYQKTLRSVKIHCLDLGLPEGSFIKDYSERDETLAWMKDQTTFKFDIDHSADAFGGRYQCHEDQKCRKKMLCPVERCGTRPHVTEVF